MKHTHALFIIIVFCSIPLYSMVMQKEDSSKKRTRETSNFLHNRITPRNLKHHDFEYFRPVDSSYYIKHQYETTKIFDHQVIFEDATINANEQRYLKKAQSLDNLYCKSFKNIIERFDNLYEKPHDRTTLDTAIEKAYYELLPLIWRLELYFFLRNKVSQAYNEYLESSITFFSYSDEEPFYKKYCLWKNAANFAADMIKQDYVPAAGQEEPIPYLHNKINICSAFKDLFNVIVYGK